MVSQMVCSGGSFWEFSDPKFQQSVMGGMHGLLPKAPSAPIVVADPTKIMSEW